MANKFYTYFAAEADPLNRNAYFDYPVYKVLLPRHLLDYYLPKQYVAFRANTRKNSANRHYFFSEQAAMFNRIPFNDYIDHLPDSVSFDYFLHQLSKEPDPTARYNFVITDDYLIAIRNTKFTDRFSRLLCKHITISSRAPYVRYAGEIWYSRYGYFVVNNSSGTYQPPDRSISQVTEILRHSAPNAYFRGTSYRNMNLL